MRSILTDEQPLTNAERLEIYRQARWERVVEYALENERVRPVLWEWLRLTWGNGSPIGRQAE